MRVISVSFLDDTDHSLRAEVARTIALDSKIVELDLSEDASQRLTELLRPFMKAGREAEALHEPQSLASPAGDMSVREYNKKMREWAHLAGRDSEVTAKDYNGRSGGYSYSAELRRDFAAFMRGEASR